MNLGLPSSVIETLVGISGLLARLPDIEEAVSKTVATVQETLDRSGTNLEEILGTVQPIQAELESLRKDASSLDERLQGIGPRLESLDSRLEELGPSLEGLDSRLGGLDDQLGRIEELLAPLESRFRELTEAANRLDGGLVHVLDRVPGLSADRARERAETPK